MDFFDYNFIITQIVLAVKVVDDTAPWTCSRRASHGLALHTSGKKTYIFENGQKLIAEKYDIIFLPEDTAYTVIKNIPGECYAINFKISEKIDFSPFKMHLKNPEKALEHFKSAEKCFSCKEYSYEYKCMSYLYSVLYCVLFERNLDYISNDTKKMLVPAINYIHSSYTNGNISIEYLAGLCNMCSSYFRRIFLNCYGMSPIKYINNLKLARAKELLAQGEFSLENAAELSGFNNIYYFFRFFKKSVGITPTQYRQSIKDD